MPEQYRRSGTPAKRGANAATAAAKPSSKPLTLEQKRERQRRERERIRRQREERARLAALRRARRKQLFRLSTVCALLFVILYWCLVAGMIIGRDKGESEILPLLIFTDGNREEEGRLEPEELALGDTAYLPVSFLEQYMAISHFGDHVTRSFLLCDSGEYATFYLGSEEAIVNDVRVSLQSPAILKDGELYLPVSFFADKMNCFTLSRAVAAYGGDVLTYYQGNEGFSFHTSPPSASVDFAAVPVAPTVPAENPA